MKDTRFITALWLTALSGCAALAHELLWTRRLIDLLGASAESNSRVFECFFLGLALGSAWSTRLTKRTRRPWRAVAVIELGIAVLALPAMTLPLWTDWLWPWLGPQRLISWVGGGTKLAVSIVVVLPPAFLMGMTLPLMAKAVLSGERKLGRHGVWLYAVNTVGGVAGLMLTITIALHRFGVAGAMALVMALNLLTAVGCLWMDRCAAAPKPTPNPDEPKRDEHRQSLPLILLVAFASGAGVLGVEVLAMHLFMQVAPSAIHAVAAVLASILLLLAVSAFLTPALASRRNMPRTLLVPVLAITGLATASAPLLFMWITHNMVTIRPADSVTLFVLKITGYVLCSFGPCLLLAGFVFPLLLAWSSGAGGDPYGRRWGWLLAVNGLGGVIGAETAQRLIMPVLGMHGALGVFGLGYAALAAVLVLAETGWRGWLGPVWRQVGVMILIVLMGAVWLLRLPLIHPNPTKEIQFKTLDMQAGPEGLVAVTDSDAMGRGIVMFNQYVLGSTAGRVDEQRQAHLPIVLHPAPRNIAFIGLATGITAGAALLHDRVESVTAIELSRLVAEACRKHFSQFNNGVFTNPRSTVVVEDGRTYIASCVDRFDVIIGDLFLPWRPGVGRLYSLEHFRAVRRALRQGGLFCQLLPMYQFNRQQQEVVLATLLEAFPEVHLFRLSFNTSMPVLAMVAFHQGGLDWQGLPQRCESVRSADKIHDVIVRHHEAIAMLYLGSVRPQDIAQQTVNTLGNAWVELNASRDFITGQWGDGYFVNNKQWLAFEEEMAARLKSEAFGGQSLSDLSRLGGQLSHWDWAVNQRAEIADQLRKQIRGNIPKPLKSDDKADLSSWGGWRVLLQQ